MSDQHDNGAEIFVPETIDTSSHQLSRDQFNEGSRQIWQQNEQQVSSSISEHLPAVQICDTGEEEGESPVLSRVILPPLIFPGTFTTSGEVQANNRERGVPNPSTIFNTVERDV